MGRKKRATIGRLLGRSLIQTRMYLPVKGRSCRKRKNRRNVMRKPAPLERSVKVAKKRSQNHGESQNANNGESQFSELEPQEEVEVATSRLPSEGNRRRKRGKKKKKSKRRKRKQKRLKNRRRNGKR